LELKWISNWYENALRRYRVQLITSPRNDDHLGLYCDEFKINAVQLENVQCFWTDNMFVVDVSEVQGPAGHSYVLLYLYYRCLYLISQFLANTRTSIISHLGISTV
jgi:hypothetical protein